MTLTNIAIQNLRRRKGKTVFLLLTFSLIIGTIVTLFIISSEMKRNLEEDLTQYGANIIISPQSESLNMSYGGLSISGVNFNLNTLINSTLEKIKENTDRSTSIAPKIIGSAKGVDENYLIVGVDFRTELRIKPWWKIHGSLPRENGIVLGSNISAANNLIGGDYFSLNGEKFLISGILEETGGSEDNVIFTSIPLARKLTMNEGNWSIIELNSPNPKDTAASLRTVLPEAKVSEITQLIQSNEENVNRFTRFSVSTSVILIFVGLLTITVTMASNINDRITEFGILRAIGFRKSHLVSILVRETLIISLLGGTIGYLIGVTVPIISSPLLLNEVLNFNFNPLIPVISIAFAVLAGMITISYPAKKALNLELTEALRYI